MEAKKEAIEIAVEPDIIADEPDVVVAEPGVEVSEVFTKTPEAKEEVAVVNDEPSLEELEAAFDQNLWSEEVYQKQVDEAKQASAENIQDLIDTSKDLAVGGSELKDATKKFGKSLWRYLKALGRYLKLLGHCIAVGYRAGKEELARIKSEEKNADLNAEIDEKIRNHGVVPSNDTDGQVDVEKTEEADKTE